MKAAIYARYSSDNQREESIDAQVRAISEYAQRNGITVVKTYVDEAESAKTDDRPNFQKMIRDCTEGIYDCIIVHKLDRFSRNRYDSAFYKKKLKENGIRLISILENLDDSPESIILESVLEGMAEYYSANLARETMKGLKETALKCRHTGGLPPLGYDIGDDKGYKLNLLEAPAVKKIFEMYSDGVSYDMIVDWLNKNGYRTKRGELFGKNSIAAILSNEKYTGVFIFNRTKRKVNSHKNKPVDEIIRIPDGMPRIIEDVLWLEVQKKLEKNRFKGGKHRAKNEYLLTGLIKCGKCGFAMTGNTRQSGQSKTTYSDYECIGKKTKHICDMRNIGREYLDGLVLTVLYNNLFAPDKIDMVVNLLYESAIQQAKEASKDYAQYQDELKGVEKQIGNIIDAVANGMFHISMKEKMNELEAKKHTLKAIIAELRASPAGMQFTKEMIRDYLLRDCDLEHMSFENKKRLIQTFVESISVKSSTIDIASIVNMSGCGGRIWTCDLRVMSPTSYRTAPPRDILSG